MHEYNFTGFNSISQKKEQKNFPTLQIKKSHSLLDYISQDNSASELTVD
jgi:hypothetical protein